MIVLVARRGQPALQLADGESDDQNHAVGADRESPQIAGFLGFSARKIGKETGERRSSK
jgi:hypothetical protein